MQLTLKAARVNRSFTQEYMAKSLGIATEKYKRWENGKSEIPARSFIEMCRILDYSVNDIILP